MKTLDDGTYLQLDGRDAVRFERRYPHPIERVWRAVTEPAELAHWFPNPQVSYDAEVGGTIRLSGDHEAPGQLTGTVLAWEPPHRFGFEWGENRLFFTLTPDGDGCRFELLDFLGARGAAARNAAGWTVCLDRMEQSLLDGAGRGAPPHQSLEWQPLLETYLAAGLPDDGWRPEQR